MSCIIPNSIIYKRAGISLLFLVQISCLNISQHVAVNKGETGQGGYDKSEDTQSASDTTTELQSRISGIDKSNQEITKNLNKQTEMMKNSRERDFQVDKSSPDVPKETRKKIYKRD